MKYTGEFDSIYKKSYKVEITTKTTGADKTIKLSGSPFVSSIASDGDEHIYCPIKCGGATVGILTENYIPDFYAGDPKAVAVKLTNTTDNRVEWTGYVTPSMYTQGFDQPKEELQLDCIDGIAVLKDIKYRSADKKIKTFQELIGYCLGESGCFKNLYITDNVQITSQTANDSVIEVFRLSEAGLFDKKDDITEPDENVAWSCYDVLYQICQYLGYTLVTHGEDVIILDYDALKKGNNKFFKYTITGSSLTGRTNATLNFNYSIKEGSYASSGSTVEMTEVYNKVTVVDEFMEQGEAEEEKENITSSNDPYWKESTIEGWGIGNWYDVCDTIIEKDQDGNNLTYQICVNRLHSENWVYTVIKFYSNSKYKFYRYSKESPYTPNSTPIDGSGVLMNSKGAAYIQYCHVDLDGDKWHNSFLFKNKDNLNAYTMDQRRDEWVRLLNRQFASLSFKECIVMINGQQGKNGHIGISDIRNTVEYAEYAVRTIPTEPYTNYPYFEYENNNPAVFGSKNSNLYITGTITTHDEWWNPWPMNNGKDNNDLRYDKKQKSLAGMFCWTKLQWGDRWYNGEGWQNTECFFRMYWWPGIKEKIGGGGYLVIVNNRLEIRGYQEHWAKRYFDKDIPLVGLDNADYVVGEDAIVIPAPQDGNLNGKVKMTFYCPRDIWDIRDGRCDRYWTCVQCLTDFKIEGRINGGGSLGDDSALDSDTVYTNVIDNGAVNELDEISFKICTYDDKNASYSTVDKLKSDGNSEWIDQTYNKANYSGEGGSMRQEEHFVYKLVSQYEQPRLRFNCNLKFEQVAPKLYGSFTDKTLSGKTFILDGVEIDYKMNKATLNLIEKW